MPELWQIYSENHYGLSTAETQMPVLPVDNKHRSGKSWSMKINWYSCRTGSVHGTIDGISECAMRNGQPVSPCLQTASSTPISVACLSVFARVFECSLTRPNVYLHEKEAKNEFDSCKFWLQMNFQLNRQIALKNTWKSPGNQRKRWLSGRIWYNYWVGYHT